MAKKEVTGKKAASVASKVLKNPAASKSAKSAAGSTLSQTKAPTKETGKKAGTAASKTLKSSTATKAAKTSAGSALTQRSNKKK